MDVRVPEKRWKSKVVGIRLYKEEYDLISAMAQRKRLSRSFIAESLIRAALDELKKQTAKTRPRSRQVE